MISSILLAIGIFVLLALAVAPLDALGWWSSKGADEAAELVTELRESVVPTTDFDHYVVYLSGIGAIDGRSVPEEEEPLIAAIAAIPGTCLIRDVFPYSVENKGLTGQRSLAWLWRRIEKLRFAKPESLAGMLINARNSAQLFVSADRRYGPTYNIGTAREVFEALHRSGYPFNTGKPVTLVGFSGGAQISIGAASYLGLGETIPVRVVSIGGMMSDDPGLNRVEQVWHLRGTKDIFEKLGGVLFAGRWPHAVFSPWSDALAEGRIKIYDLGPMNHNGKAHYFDPNTFSAQDGRSYLQITIDAVVAVLTDQPVRTVTE